MEQLSLDSRKSQAIAMAYHGLGFSAVQQEQEKGAEALSSICRRRHNKRDTMERA